MRSIILYLSRNRQSVIKGFRKIHRTRALRREVPFLLLVFASVVACQTGAPTAIESGVSVTPVRSVFALPTTVALTPTEPSTITGEVTALPVGSPRPLQTATAVAQDPTQSNQDQATPVAILLPTPTPTSTPVPVTWAPGSPNIVFIVTDDQTVDMMEYMNLTRELLVAQGASFTNFFVTTPLCCPARSTILTGQYAHNHGVQHNSNSLENGGFAAFFEKGREKSTIASALNEAGYQTALFGKYLNGYPLSGFESHVPSGWDEWYAYTTRRFYYNIRLNENGRLTQYSDETSDYSTDVLASKAIDFIRRQASHPAPFFAYISPYAPHLPAVASPRDKESFQEIRFPRDPSFNEDDVSDKPDWISKLEPLNLDEIADIDLEYRQQIRALQAVDTMVGRIVGTLLQTNELDNTYIIFTSDNGMHRGIHRLPTGKGTPYDPDIRVPFVIRGPGIDPGSVVDDITLLTDLAPTFAELGSAVLRHETDGRSLLPLFNANPSHVWRNSGLIEYWSPNEGPNEIPSYRAIRSASHLYVEWSSGEVELYDLSRDPFQLENLGGENELSAVLSARLEELAACQGQECSAIEDIPVP